MWLIDYFFTTSSALDIDNMFKMSVLALVLILLIIVPLVILSYKNKKKIRYCKWCGKKTPPRFTLFCMECKRPLSKLLYSLSISKLLILPVFIFIVGYVLQQNQRNIDRKMENEKWKFSEYKAFSDAYIDFRTSSLEIQLILQNRKTIIISDLKKSIINFDRAFNIIGYRLMPFDIRDMQEKNESCDINDSTTKKKVDFHEKWFKNFLLPYYGGYLSCPDDTDRVFHCNDQSSYCKRYQQYIKDLEEIANDDNKIIVNNHNRAKVDSLCNKLQDIIDSVFIGKEYILKIKGQLKQDSSIKCLSQFFEDIKGNIYKDTTKINYFNSSQVKILTKD